jgi:putative transposase
VLHVTQRGHSREAVFAHPHDHQYYLECLVQAGPRVGVSIHAYVLMTNHVHLLVTTGTDRSIRDLMQELGRRYVRRFNARQGRTGALREGRFRAAVIDSDAYLLACMRYIKLNPVRAGLCASADDYRWSSYRANARGESNVAVHAHPTYDALARDPDARQQAYRSLFEAPLSESALQAIRAATDHQRRSSPKRCPEQLFGTTR